MPRIHQRLVNPRKTSTTSAAARGPRRSRPRRSNPLGGGELILATMGNPKNRGKANRANSGIKRRGNPSLRANRRSSRRNPRGIGQFSIEEVGKASIGAAAGSLATPAITQMVLGSKNTGPIGYLANAAVALGLGFGAAAVLSPIYALGIAAGGIGSTILRIWSENVSKTMAPSALSGLGDLNFSHNGMGAYVQTPYPLPTTSSRQGQFQIVQNPWPAALPPAPTGPAPAQLSPATAAAAAASPSATTKPGSSSRFASRFAA